MDKSTKPQQLIPPEGKQIDQTIRTREAIDPQSRQWQLSSYDITEEIRHQLDGEIPVDNQGGNIIQWKRVKEPLCNDTGINEIISYISIYLNKNVHLSYFTPEEIATIMLDLECTLTRKFELDWIRTWDGRYQDVDIVFNWLTNIIWAALQRARFGGEKQFFEASEQKTVTLSQGQQQKPQGLAALGIPLLGR